MNFFIENKRKLIIIYSVIAISISLYVLIALNFNDLAFLICSPLAIPIFIYLAIEDEEGRKKRIANLTDYAAINCFDF